MRIKIFVLLFFSLLTTAGYAQSGLVCEEPVWDFGMIQETDGSVSHRFVCRNTSDAPQVLLEVTTPCGCTRPAFSREPIPAGGSTEIVVTYDPTGRPGFFARELAVFTADRRVAVRLKITGTVEK